MAVDSINGGSNFESKRYAIEQQRSRELEAIERKKREDILSAEEAKNQAIHRVLDDSVNQVDEAQNQSETKIKKAKDAADARIKAYEQDSAKMAEDAKRQYQVKAQLLQKNAEALDQQRKHMQKQHQDSMMKLKEDHELSYLDHKMRNDKEEESMRYQQQLKIKNSHAQADHEIYELEQQLNDRKIKEQVESERTLRQIALERDNDVATIQNEINYFKRAGVEQSEHERALLKRQQTQEQLAYQDHMMNLGREQSTALNRTHNQGRHKLQEAKEQYATEIYNSNKDAQKRIKDTELKVQLSTEHLEKEAKVQEQLAAQSHNFKQQQMKQAREKVLMEYGAKNDEIRKVLNEEHKKYVQNLVATKDQQLKTQTQELDSQIKLQRQSGEKQIDKISLNNSQTIQSHTNKNSDPFYNLHQVNPSVQENEKEIVIQVPVAEHEKDSIRLSHQPNSIVVSGTRRYQDIANNENGHRLTTNSFQSYSESFPVSGKLEMKKMTRVYADGRVIYTIPKG